MTAPRVGRNDPCPCGSGKKYKKCHGQDAPLSLVSHPGVARATALKAVDIDLGTRLIRFSKSRFGSDWLAHAAAQYVGQQGVGIPEADMGMAIPWALFSLRDSSEDQTVAETWRREQGRKVSPDQHALLDAYAAAWMSVWEVSEVERGVGARIADLLTGEKRFVYDVQASKTVQPLDAMLAFILDCGDVSFFGGVHSQPLPPRWADHVVREAKRICRVRTRPPSIDKLQNTDIQLAIIDCWNATVAQMVTQQPPVMTNTDGDPIAMTTDRFDLLGPRDDVADRLKSMDGAEDPELERDDIVFAITKPANAVHREWSNTVIGRVVLSKARLVVETNSTRRADVLRTRLEKHLAGLIQFRMRGESNLDDLMERARESARSGSSRADDPPPPEAAAMMHEFRQQHMTAWLDDSIPALGGLTPRAAARTARGRHALEVLLKEFEQHEAHYPADQRIDIGGLRSALELPPRR